MKMQSSITIGIPEELSNRLKQLVDDRKTSRNSIIREGIELVLAKYKY